MSQETQNDQRVWLEVRLAKLEDGQRREEQERAELRNEMRDGFGEMKLLLKERTADHDRRIQKLEQDSYRQKYFIAGAIAAVSFVLEALRRFFNL